MESTFIQRVYEVFNSAQMPDENTLTPHRCIECDDIRDSFKNLSAKEIPLEKIEWLAQSFPLLYPTAVRYFFPRCIEFGIQNPTSWVNEDLITFLSMQNHEDIFFGFTNEEKLLIEEFVQLIQKSESFILSSEEFDSAFAFLKVS